MALGLSFAFDPQKGETPETVARRRALAEMILGRSLAPKNVGEGWHAIANGVVAAVQNHRANKAEAAGQTSAAAAFSPLLDAFRARISGGFPAAPTSSNVPNPGNSTAMATAPAPDIASARVAQARGDSTLPAGNLSEQQRAYVQMLLPAALEQSKRTGIDPRIIVAQSAQETGWGKSAPGNNYFGIKSHGKGGGQALKTHEYINGKRVNVTDSFRTFASPEESVRGYGDFILQNKRYKALREAKGLDAQLAALQASGYATDPNYAKSVGAIARMIPLPEAQPPQVASGMTPDILQNGAATSYAPPLAGNPAVDAVNTLGTAEPVPVAETEEEILAQEAAMAAQDPQAFRRITPGAATDMPMLVYDREGMRMAPETPNPARMPNAVPYAGPGAATDYPQVIYDDQGFRVEQPGAPSVGTAPRLPQPVPQQMAAAPAPQPAPPLPDPRMVQDMPVAGVPQQPVQVAQAGGFPEMAGNNPQALPAPGPSIDAILNVLTHPFASEQQRAFAQMFLDQHMQAQDPMRQLDMEKKRLEVEQMRNPTPKDTDDIREYQFAVSQGYQGTFQDFMTDMKRAGAMNVNVDTGTIPQGYEAIRDENGRVIRYQPIPGGPADTSAADAAAAESQEVATDTVMEAAKKARQALRGPGLPATGTVGKLMSALPESNAAEVRRQVAVMQATARVENLQAMRAASPTGGALGNVSDAEGAMLAAKAGALDPDSPTFERDLDDYERTLLRIIHGKKVGDAIFEQTREDEGGDWQDFGGVKIRRKQ